jgi:hypothetical protein
MEHEQKRTNTNKQGGPPRAIMPFRLLNPKKKEPAETPTSPPPSGVAVGKPIPETAKACNATLAVDKLEMKLRPEDSPECAAVAKQMEEVPRSMQKLYKRMTGPEP